MNLKKYAVWSCYKGIPQYQISDTTTQEDAICRKKSEDDAAKRLGYDYEYRVLQMPLKMKGDDYA